MSSLDAFTSDDLAKELLRREEINMLIPAPLNAINQQVLGQLRKLAIEYIQSLVDDTIRCKDAEHYMYEYVMEMFYGPDIWEFINHNQR